MLVARQLHVTPEGRDGHLLSGIDFDLAAGEQVAVIGPSGAGKTTLLHTLACAQRPQSGELQLFSSHPWQLSQHALQDLRKRLWLAPQSPPLPPRQRVINAVSAALLPQWSAWQSLRNLFAPIDAEPVWQALRAFGLQDKLYAHIADLSGGEMQRVGLARILLTNAELLLIDEPLSALDPALAQQSLQILLTHARARKAALICSLHQIDMALQNFERIIGLRDGRIVFDAAPNAITQEMLSALYAQETAHTIMSFEPWSSRNTPPPC